MNTGHSATRQGHAGSIASCLGNRPAVGYERNRFARPLARRLEAAFVLVLVGSLGHSGLVAAQENAAGTPVRTVSAAACRAEPRPLADFAAIADATPGSFAQRLDGTPVARAIPPDGGVPAEPEVVEAIDAALQQIGACTATRDVRLFSALWTDTLFRETLSGVDLSDILTGTPEAVAEPLPVPTVDAVRLLPDGRFAAMVRSDQGRGIAVFVEAAGRYLLDDSFDLTADGTPTP